MTIPKPRFTQRQLKSLRLQDAYFTLRDQSSGLKAAGQAFEGTRWHLSADGKMVTRRAGKSEMRVYKTEGVTEVAVILPDGTAHTFS